MTSLAAHFRLRSWREWLASWGLPIAFLLVVCIAWQASINAGSISSALLPRPTDVVSYLGRNAIPLISQAAVTGRQALASLLLASAFGVMAGSAIFTSTLAREMLYPVVLVLQVLPKVAVAPLFVIWFGTDDASRIAFGAFLSFFPVLLATIAGLEQSDQNAIRLCRSLIATPAQTFWAVRMPYAMPHILAGLKIAATLAVTGVVIGEFMTADSGLGFLILTASTRIDSKALFGAIVMLCVIGLALFGVALIAEALFRRWYFGK